jgi:hypothetical protein
LKDTPELSNRQIAETLKVDDKTVGSVRAKLEDGAEIPHHDKRTDKARHKTASEAQAFLCLRYRQGAGSKSL